MSIREVFQKLGSRLLVTFLLTLCFCTAAHAQDGSSGHESVTIPSLPDNPTAALLSMDASKFVHPTTPREFSVELLNGYNFDTETFEPGTAVEVAPFWLVVGKDTTLADWQADYFRRLASRTALSAAVKSVEQESETTDDTVESTLLAVSLKSVLWDDRDPRWDDGLVTCVKKALASIEPRPGQSEAQILLNKQKRDAAIDECKSDFRERVSKKQGSQLAFAASYIALGSSTNRADFERDQFAGWLTYSYGTQRSSKDDAWLQALTGVKYLLDSGGDADNQSIHAAAGVSGGFSQIDLEGRFAWTPTFPGTGDSQTGAYAAGGLVQFYASDDLAVGFDVGGAFGADVEKTELRGFLLVTFDGAEQRMGL